MPQPKRLIGHEKEYPYAWPIYEVFCPECKRWSKDYGDVDVEIPNGEDHSLCLECSEKIEW